MKKLFLLFLIFISFTVLFIGFETALCMENVQLTKKQKRAINRTEWALKMEQAIFNGNLEQFKKICSTKEHANTKICAPHYNPLHSLHLDTPLHLAAFYRNTKIIRYLCSIGANVNLLDCYNQTPLFALLVSHMRRSVLVSTKSYLNIENVIDCIDLLLKNGSDVTLKAKVFIPVMPHGSYDIINPIEYLLCCINNNIEPEDAKKFLKLFAHYNSLALQSVINNRLYTKEDFIKIKSTSSHATQPEDNWVTMLQNRALGLVQFTH